jgi:hypothetical protein
LAPAGEVAAEGDARIGGGRRRGGERRPRARFGPGGGGRLRPIRKDSCKVPPYATTSVGFATTSCESATGSRCSVTQTDYNITRSTRARASGRFLPEGSSALFPVYHPVRDRCPGRPSRPQHRTLSANNGKYRLSPPVQP